MKETRVALVCAVLYVAQAALEIVTFALGDSFPGYSMASHAVGLPMALIWLVAAYCAIKRPAWGWYPPVIAAAGSLATGFALLVPEARLLALAYLIPGIITALSLRWLVLPHRGAEPLITRHLTERQNALLDRIDRRLPA